MKSGKAFELFVKTILLSIGFSEVKSDGLYVFDGAPGQMLQGLGEAHNADVLLEPPVQTPFYSATRLLIECKDYQKRIGLNTVRSVLGLREDINHFEIVDLNELKARRRNRRNGMVYDYPRYSYQVALAAINGFTSQAQKFAATHRIPLIEFNKLPFWVEFCELMRKCEFNAFSQTPYCLDNEDYDQRLQEDIFCFSREVGDKMAVAITNSGQMIFLYKVSNNYMSFDNEYTIRWSDSESPWVLRSGNNEFIFQLPKDIAKIWLSNASSEIDQKKDAIYCKMNYLSNMVVYYREYDKPTIKMLSINQEILQYALDALEN